MEIKRVWAMPNKWTFQVKPIKELLDRYIGNGKGWIDPFAGETHICEYEDNDDALTFINDFDDIILEGAVLDPPYSYRQLFKTYKAGSKTLKGKMVPMTEINNRIACKIKPGGCCISFGWNSNGVGMKRGFEIVEILLVAHGGHHNDTIITVEKRILPSDDETIILDKEGR